MLFRSVDDLRPLLDFPLELLFNNENLGFAAAINGAIRHDIETTGGHSHYLLLNNDAQANSGLVAGLLESHALHPKRRLVSPSIQWGDELIRYHYYQPYLGHITSRAFPGSFPYLSGCFLLVDARALQNGTLFDKDFFMYGEDAELSYRILQSGGQLHCADHLVALHQGAASSRNGSMFYEYHVARGHVLLAKKLSRNRLEQTIFMIGRIGYMLARALIRATRNRSLTPLRAYLLCWRPARPEA